MLAALLIRHGWRRSRIPTGADLLIVNTCAFIEDAQKESLEGLFSACALKDAGAATHIVAAGCLAQIEGDSLARQIPQLDLIVGVNDWPRVPGLLKALSHCPTRRLYRSSTPPLLAPAARVPLKGRHTRYLKIAEGCDCGCGFCVIPRIRGAARSMPEDAVLREARALLRSGAKELVLVAQDTTAYGHDRTGMRGLAPLLDRVAQECSAGGVGERWIRVLYLHPSKVDDSVIRAMTQRPVLPYFDLALQHSSSRVLRQMRRPVPENGWEPLIDRIRAHAPQAILRATILLGHPGEKRSDFTQLLKFLEWADLDRVGLFRYSPQPGTPSAGLDAPPAAEVGRRLAATEDLLLDQATRHAAQMLGRQFLVLVDGPSTSGGVTVRPWTDAPDIDWHYHLPICARQGSLIEATVVGALPGSVELEPVQD